METETCHNTHIVGTHCKPGTFPVWNNNKLIIWLLVTWWIKILHLHLICWTSLFGCSKQRNCSTCWVVWSSSSSSSVMKNARVWCTQMQQTVVASSASHDSSIGRHFRDVIRPHPGMSRDFIDILLVTSTKQVMRLSRFVCLSHGDRDFSKRCGQIFVKLSTVVG